MVSGWCQDCVRMVTRDGVQRTAALLMTSAMSRSRSRRMLPASAALIADTGHWLGWSHSLPGELCHFSCSNCSDAGMPRYLSLEFNAIRHPLDNVEIHDLIQ